MNSRDKLIAMVIIWGAAVLISLMLFVGKDMINFGEGLLGFFLFMGVIGGTIAISQADESSNTSERKERTIRESSKLKREDTQLIDRLVESMDDDERAALMQRLSTPDDYTITDDGELRKHTS